MTAVFLDTLRFLKKRIGYGYNRIRNPALYDYHGVRIPLTATPELGGIRKRVYLGLYEQYEINAVRGLVRHDDVVVEIGAGCGVVSVVIAQRLVDDRNLYCFEANSKLVPSIQALIAANGVHPSLTMSAVGRSSGEVELYSSNAFLSSSLVKRDCHSVTEIVSVTAFAELMTRLSPTCLVMDIEGAEMELLSGEMPDRLRTIIVEVHPHIIGNRAVSEIVGNLIAQRFDLLLEFSNKRVMAFSKTPSLDTAFGNRGFLSDTDCV